MTPKIDFPSAWASRLVSAQQLVASPRAAARPPSAARHQIPGRRPSTASSHGTLTLGSDPRLPARTALVVPILTASARVQFKGTHAMLADSETRLHGLIVAYQGAWVCWRQDDSVPLAVGMADAGMANGPAVPELLARALADGARVVTGNAKLLTSLLERRGWPELPLVCEIGALLRSLNLPADAVGSAVHLLHQPIAPMRAALADVRWRAETVETQGLGPAVEHAWMTARVHAQIAMQLDGLLGYEAAAWKVHERINHHGARVDRRLAKRCAILARKMRRVLIDKAQQYTPEKLSLKVMGDLKQVQAILAPLGVQIRSLSVPSLEMVMTRLPKSLPKRTEAQWILAAVIVCRQVEGGRFSKLLAYASDDGVLRGAYVYCGAHPGRWTSEGAQLQNMKRSVLPPDVAELIIAAINGASTRASDTDAITETEAHALAEMIVGIAGSDYAHACLSGLLRLCFLAREKTTFAIADLALIELRILNWLANDQRVLAKLADPKHDAHTATAEIIWQDEDKLTDEHPEYDLRRNLIAKKVNHGFGFGLSADAAEQKADKDWGVDLAALKLTGAYLHEVYHRRFPRVRTVWSNLIAAAVQAITSRNAVQAGPVSFRPCSFGLAAVLPSGRVMIYAGARVEKDEYNRDIIIFTKYGDSGTLEECKLWGSKLAQHVCEAVGRDLLIDMMAAIQAAGYAVALHAHDELVVEVPENGAAEHLKIVESIMSTTPGWAKGLPLLAEGHLSKRFSKKSMFMG